MIRSSAGRDQIRRNGLARTLDAPFPVLAEARRRVCAMAMLGSASAIMAFVQAQPAHSASFSCTRATTFIEKAVCADPVLSRKDDTMAALYRSARTTDPSGRTLAAQRAWLAELTSCRTPACVSALYDRRIAELGGDVQSGVEVSFPLRRGGYEPVEVPCMGGGLDASVTFNGGVDLEWFDPQCRVQNVRRVGPNEYSVTNTCDADVGPA